MDTSALKKFAQSARQALLEQVASKLAYVLKPESPARREYPDVVAELERQWPREAERSVDHGLHLVQSLLRTAFYGRQWLQLGRGCLTVRGAGTA